MRVLQAGDRGVLLDFDAIGFDELHGAVRRLSAVAGAVAAIPGHSSVLVLFEGEAVPSIAAHLDDVHQTEEVTPREHRLDVSIADEDAPDLPPLLAQAGIDREQFAAALSSLDLRARWLGFLSGFAYLEGVPAAWELPRRATPRPRVPRGSLGFAGPMAGFYPDETPGGWNLVGRTNASLWDPDRNPPNLIAAGDVVRARIVARCDVMLPLAEKRATAGSPIFDVESPGQLTAIVGAADPARYRYGLPSGGAMDPIAHAAANVAVGNHPGANALECVLVGPRLVARTDLLLGWQGAYAAIRVDGRAIASATQFHVSKGAVLDVGPLGGGLRGWLAVRGGIGRRGPRWPSAAERLVPGPYAGEGAAGERARIVRIARGDHRVIAVRLGPHAVDPELRALLFSETWHVTSSIDRVGIRITGKVKHAAIPTGLRSCGMQPGTVQWHPDGDLVVMGPDHPVTGGYLQPMTVLAGELWKLAQLAPGEIVRWVDA